MNSYLIAGIVMALCTACAPKPEQITHSVTPAQSVPAAVKKTLKPGAPVSLIDAQPVILKVNQIAALTLRLQAPSQGRLIVNLSTSDGLQLVDTLATQTLELSSTEVALPVRLLAVSNGRFYLNLEATLETAEARSSRTMALVVQVGDIAEKSLKPSVQALTPRGIKSETSADEAVISLPAQETIQER